MTKAAAGTVAVAAAVAVVAIAIPVGAGVVTYYVVKTSLKGSARRRSQREANRAREDRVRRLEEEGPPVEFTPYQRELMANWRAQRDARYRTGRF